MTLRLGWFTAGRGPGSRGMFERTLAAIDSGMLDAEVKFVFMQRERGEGDASDSFADFAALHQIPVISFSSQRFRREHDGDLTLHREKYDSQIATLIAPYDVDLCVLAGYLLILSPVLIGTSTFLNLHPALPGGPIGLWQQVIWELIDRRATETGNMALSVTNDLDRGPQLSYNRVSITGDEFDSLWGAVGNMSSTQLKIAAGEEHPLFSAIRAAGVRREPLLLLETLKAIARGSLNPRDPPKVPLDLTEEVEAALGSL